MARLNQRYVSSTPARGSSTLVDNTPNAAQSSAYGAHQASPTGISDKENQPIPAAGDKAKGRMLPPSASLNGARSAKRMRLDQPQSGRRASGNVENEQDQLDGRKYYNPDQNPEERQALKRQSRALEREFNGAYSLTYTPSSSANTLQIIEMSIFAPITTAWREPSTKPTRFSRVSSKLPMLLWIPASLSMYPICYQENPPTWSSVTHQPASI